MAAAQVARICAAEAGSLAGHSLPEVSGTGHRSIFIWKVECKKKTRKRTKKIFDSLIYFGFLICHWPAGLWPERAFVAI